MIGRLTGALVEKHPPSLLIDVQGVGYEIEAPMSTFYSLPGTGETISLFTHLVVRDDAHLLFGFATLRFKHGRVHKLCHQQRCSCINPSAGHWEKNCRKAFNRTSG